MVKIAEVIYTSIVWTAGDFITEAKKDTEIANARAVDAMAQGNEYAERADPSTPGANKLHIYGKDKSGVSALFGINDAGTVFELSEGRPTFLFAITGTLVTGTSLTPIIPVHRPLTIIKAFAVVKVAPVGDDIIIDLNKNGSTIWTTQANRLTIPAGSTTASQSSFNVSTLADEDILTADIDQIGSSTPGADLTIYLRCK